MPDGVIKSVIAEGHAGEASAGHNIVCAAASVLLRTAYRTAAKNRNLEIRFSAEKTGEMFFEIKNIQINDLPWIAGITDFLITGLKDLENEYPEDVKLELNYLE